MQIAPEIEPPDPDELLAEYRDEFDPPEQILQIAYVQYRYNTDDDTVWTSYYDDITDEVEIVETTDTVYVKTGAHHLHHEITREDVSEAKPTFDDRTISPTPVTKPEHFAEKEKHYYTDLTEVVCPSCDGDLHTCFVCDGTLQEACQNCNNFGEVPHKVPCPTCGGTNERSRTDCRKCDSGRVETTERCSHCGGDGEIERETTCSKCGGEGRIGSGRDRKDCPECSSTFSIRSGTGTQTETVTCTHCQGEGKYETREACSNCDGQGTVPQKCHECDSDGRVEETKPCPKCGGSQTVPCTTCGQTGEYCRTCRGSGEVCEYTLVTSKSRVTRNPEHTTDAPPIETVESDWRTYYESEEQEIDNETGVVAIKRTDTVLPVREVTYTHDGDEYTIYHYNGKYVTDDVPTTRVTLDDVGQDTDSGQFGFPSLSFTGVLGGLLGVPVSIVFLVFALDFSSLPLQLISGLLWIGTTYKITTKPSVSIPGYAAWSIALAGYLFLGDPVEAPTVSRLLALLALLVPLGVSVGLYYRD